MTACERVAELLVKLATLITPKNRPQTRPQTLRYDLHWAGDELRLLMHDPEQPVATDRLLATVERDGARPNLWCVRLPDGTRSDAADRDRVRAGAVTLAVESLTADGLSGAI